MNPALCLKKHHASLEARALACERGGRVVFSGLDLDLRPGEALVLTGRNGSGKTSLLRVLAGLLRPASGTLRIHDGAPDMTLAEHAHFIGQQDGARPALSVREHIGFWSGLLRDESHVPPTAAFGLDALADTPASYLSSGQRRRLALNRLLAAPRPLWLLDEPLNALDEAARGMVRQAVAAHREAGGIAVIATHEPLGLAGARDHSMDTEPRA